MPGIEATVWRPACAPKGGRGLAHAAPQGMQDEHEEAHACAWSPGLFGDGARGRGRAAPGLGRPPAQATRSARPSGAPTGLAQPVSLLPPVGQPPGPSRPPVHEAGPASDDGQLLGRQLDSLSHHSA